MLLHLDSGGGAGGRGVEDGPGMILLWVQKGRARPDPSSSWTQLSLGPLPSDAGGSEFSEQPPRAQEWEATAMRPGGHKRDPFVLKGLDVWLRS